MPPLTPPTRRTALGLLSAGIAAGLGACSKPSEELVPYVVQPERLLPGVPVRYATALSLGGWARGVHAIAMDGRPIKIEGNPLHPASLGATDVFAEAAILDLYDPDRSRTVTERVNGIASWAMAERALAAPLSQARRGKGKGLRLLTGRVTSPTLIRQIAALLTALPEARWHVHEPLADDAALKGAELAFGRRYRALPDPGRAETILCVGADPLGPGPDQIRFSRAFMDRRRDPARFGRLYVAETALSQSGIKADARHALHPRDAAGLIARVANRLGAGLPTPDLPPEAARFAEAAATDLTRTRGRALILVGDALPPELHALGHWINGQIEAPVAYLPPDGTEPADLATLAADLDAGAVSCLAILGCNPAHTAPADLAFADRIGRAGFSLHAGTHGDETAGLTHWHWPLAHELESWSDLRATDGTASLVQPLVRPLYGARSVHEILSLIAGEPASAGYDLVRATWRDEGGGDFEGWWRKALHDGVIPGSATAPVDPGPARLPALPARAPIT
ncbi:MAG: 4Fe-4S ferredoxin, partial [Parafilimonas terrae]|nr:4Fe-4S ferredoxin [Parafilimonas terrae]